MVDGTSLLLSSSTRTSRPSRGPSTSVAFQAMVSPISGRDGRLVGADLAAVLSPAGVIAAFTVDALVRVRAEEVAQALDEVRRAALAAVTVVVGQRRGERRHLDP